MKRVSSFTNELNKTSEDYIKNNVLKDDDIQYFIVKNNLSSEQISDNLETFYEFYIAKQMKLEFSHSPKLEIINDRIYLNFAETPEYREQRIRTEFSNRIKTEYISKKVLKADFENLSSSVEKTKLAVEIIKLCDKIIEKETTKGMYIYGPTGIGKTYLLGCIYNYFRKSGIEPAIIYYPEFIRKMKAKISNGGHEEYIDLIRQEKILIIDDIGAENITEYVRDEILGPIINYRESEELPTFFSSNLSYEDLLMTMSTTKNSMDYTRGFRIIQRIRTLSKEIKLDGVNERDFS